jgi:hypothetical protein
MPRRLAITIERPHAYGRRCAGSLQLHRERYHLIDSRVDGLRMSQVPEKDLHVFKAGMRKRFSQMLRKMWGPVLSLPAIPGSDLILESVLDRMISKM